jgi:hypothetical protein
LNVSTPNLVLTRIQSAIGSSAFWTKLLVSFEPPLHSFGLVREGARAIA